MFVKKASKAVPKPSKCEKCGGDDFEYIGHTEELVDFKGYLWKCKKCGSTEFVPKKP